MDYRYITFFYVYGDSLLHFFSKILNKKITAGIFILLKLISRYLNNCIFTTINKTSTPRGYDILCISFLYLKYKRLY